MARKPTHEPEEWRDIPGFEGLYQASTLGRVRRIFARGRTRVLNGYYAVNHKNTGDFVQYVLRSPSVRNHTFLGTTIMRNTFMGGAREGYSVHHINGCKTDNRLCNLEFIRMEELGRRSGHIGSRIPVMKIDREGNAVEFYSGVREAAHRNGCSKACVSRRCRGEVRNEYDRDGYTYRYDD